jgi:hypothetical protein
VWLLVPLLVVWGNLHGGVLLGVAVVFGYLAVARGRREPLLAGGVAAAAAAAVLANPAGLGSVSYYHGLLTNVAAQRGDGMWGPLSLTSPVDLITIAAAVGLALAIRRTRVRAWELAVGAGLIVLTVQAARNGVFLLFFLAPLAARTLAPRRVPRVLVPVAATVSMGLLALGLARGPVGFAGSPAVIKQAVALAHGSPLLAEDGMDEQVALAGGRISVGEPIDAFSRAAQSAYLDFVQGAAAGRQALSSQVRVVLVQRGSEAQGLMRAAAGFTLVGGDRKTAIYERAPRSLEAALR